MPHYIVPYHTTLYYTISQHIHSTPLYHMPPYHTMPYPLPHYTIPYNMLCLTAYYIITYSNMLLRFSFLSIIISIFFKLYSSGNSAIKADNETALKYFKKAAEQVRVGCLLLILSCDFIKNMEIIKSRLALRCTG